MIALGLLPGCENTRERGADEAAARIERADPPGATVTTSPAVATKPPPRCAGVQLTIEAAGTKKDRTFVGTIVNGGTTPVVLVMPGDGSEDGDRSPVLTWQAHTLAGKPAKPVEMGGCAWMNPIHESEVFTLAPGERKGLGDWLGAPRVEPGRYVVRLTYDNRPELVVPSRRGHGVDDSAALALIRRSTPCTVVSQPLTVDL